uniref:Uncharacterized protein n=1 Tax=Schistosoma haematobium TaxID=6185 RepID=A0A095A7T9_SCHHA
MNVTKQHERDYLVYCDDVPLKINTLQSLFNCENGQCVLHDLTIHSNLTDKHQFVVSSPISLSIMSIIQNHLTRELEEINVELASMLEKCNRAYECPTVKMNLMKDQYERRLTDLNSECTSLQNISQRDLKKTKEQVSVTVQELFSLTFLNS